jgi:hypothetical protein
VSAPEGFYNRDQIADHVVMAIRIGRGPIRIPMAAGVKRHGMVAGTSQGFTGSLPGMSRLSPAML